MQESPYRVHAQVHGRIVRRLVRTAPARPLLPCHLRIAGIDLDQGIIRTGQARILGLPDVLHFTLRR